jgi:hypothetical protein
VKQDDLCEYEENAREKQNIHVYKSKAPNSPSNQVIWMANIKFQTQEGSNQNTRFLNAKNHTPLEPKAKHNKHQTQSKTRIPPEVKNPMFYQMSLDKPQGNHRPLKQ